MSDNGHRGPALRIGFLTSARSWRGSTVSLSGLATGLRDRGHHVRLLVGEAPIADAVRALGIPAELVPAKNTGLREVRWIRRLIRRDRLDVIMADRPRDLRVAALASLGRRLALVYRFNVRRERPPADLITRLAYWRVGATVFLTPEWQEQTLARVPFMARVPHRVIWNGVDARAFRPDPESGQAFRARYQLGSGPLLVASGALFPDKRVDVLIAAVAALPEPRPPLLVCGVGSQEAALRQEAARLGAPVRFLGFLSVDELRGALNAAACLVHAGPVETFGRSVAEAMACERPVIAVRAGSLPDVVGDAGILVSPDDPQAMAHAITDLLGNPSLQSELGRRGRIRCLERFSFERSVTDYETLFQDLVSSPP